MATFVVEFEYSVSREQRGPVHPAHAAYLRDLSERGILLLGGPIAGREAGLLVYQVDNAKELAAVLAEEPYVRAGFVASRRISHWRPGKGSLAKHLIRAEEVPA